MTKTSHSQPLQRTSSSLQPWIRDHYAALRAEAGPRLQQTRAVVVPVIVDTSHKVRDEYVPAAVQLSSRVAHEAVHRSAPLRADLSDRAIATLAAARGQTHKNQSQNNGHSHRKLWFIGGAAAAGAALTTAAVLWQRSRYQAWVEDDATQNAMDDAPEPQRLNADDPNHNPTPHPEGADENAHASSTNQHGDHHQQ